MLSLALSLLLLCASAAPITNIRIDGNFDDWNSVAKRFDPFRPTINDPVVFDGVPATPDVHDTDSTGE
jgi:hypothetical protein